MRAAGAYLRALSLSPAFSIGYVARRLAERL
jgi:hypothetical protein